MFKGPVATATESGALSRENQSNLLEVLQLSFFCPKLSRQRPKTERGSTLLKMKKNILSDTERELPLIQ